jgi:hypothetical protein
MLRQRHINFIISTLTQKNTLIMTPPQHHLLGPTFKKITIYKLTP